LVASFDVTALELLDPRLLTVDVKKITRVRSTNGDAPMTVEAKDGQWQVEAGAVKFMADPSAMAALLTVCSNLRADRFVAYGDKVDLAKYGLDKPAYTLTVTVQPADKDAKPMEYTVAIGKPAEGERGARYLRLTDKPGVAVIDAEEAAELGRTYLDFVDRTLWKLDAPAVTGITRQMGDKELGLARKDDAWGIVKPAEQRADTELLDSLVARLANLRAQGIAAYPAKDLKTFGLAEPTAVLTVKVGGDKAKDYILKIGHAVNPDAKAATGQDRYAIVEGGQAVGVLPAALVDRLLAAPIKFRDRSLAKFASADKVTLERGPRKATFTNVDGTWKQTEPVEAKAEQNDLDEFINDLARLKADELVAEKPAELKAYGLDKPEAKWRFLAGDKEVLGLDIGAIEKEKAGAARRCYARLAGSDVVFLLSPKLTARVLGEYRSRTLWTGLDPVKIERVEFKYADKPFTLEKVGSAWKVVGKPDFKVNEKAVNDTLAALADLKAERTVVDKEPDLKLFGLDPPHLVLEIHTDAGSTKVLKIGRSEGDSKRSYAMLADGSRGDVFIISEKDGERILRELGAFGK
jgi:hypothetical protein